MNLYIAGFMGTGKTTIGKRLADELECNWIDLDQYIANKVNQSISDLFSQYGEDYFRNLEEACLEEVAQTSRTIVTTGGGTVMRERNRQLIRNRGFWVTLTASIDCIWKRIQNDSGRPLLQREDPLAFLEQLLSERSLIYKQCDFEVDTTNKSIDEIVKEIITELRRIQFPLNESNGNRS